MKTAFVTGATGFIGGRLVEKLVLNQGMKVRALVRNYARAARLARFDVEMIHGDASSVAAIQQAVRGCDAVFHCAHDFREPYRNIAAASVIAEACCIHQIERLVHVSSMSVYEPLADGALDESSPSEPCGWVYPDNKLAVERLLLERARSQGLPVVVLQPTIVYGPFGSAWTESVVQRMRKKRIVLPERGEGLCNAVYVDDVVDALIRSAGAREGVGERMLVSGPSPVTWGQFFGGFEEILGVRSIVKVGPDELETLLSGSGVSSNGHALSIQGLRERLTRTVRRGVVQRTLKPVKHLLGERWRARARQGLLAPLEVPNEQLMSLYRAKAVVDTGKARRLLGYEPAFDFAKGMRLTGAFISWANL